LGAEGAQAFVAARPTSTTLFGEERMKGTNEAAFGIKIAVECISGEAAL
jgi:hypothetical protein